jgi:uncharacterized membrane protein YgcG
VIAAVALLLGSVILAVPKVVQAQTTISCGQLVVDNAGIFGAQLTDVNNAAQDLATAGVEVRVITLTDMGGAGNLDLVEQNFVKSCPAIQSTDGKRKNNVVELFISMKEHQWGIYYGGAWDKPFGNGEYNRIGNDILKPAFQRGDFAGGFIQAMGEIGRLIAQFLHPSGQATPAPTQPVPVIVKTGPPPNLTGLWIVLGLVVLLVGLWLLFKGLRSVRANRELKHTAQANAQLARQQTRNKLETFNADFDTARQELQIISGLCAPDELKPMTALLVQAKQLGDSASAQYTGLASGSAGDPDRDGLSVGEYNAIEKQYAGDLLEGINKAQKQLDGAKVQIATLKQFAQTAPDLVAKAKAALSDATAKVEQVKSQGFKAADSAAPLTEASQALGQIDAMIGQKRFGSAAALLAKVTEQVTTARKSAETQVEQKQTSEKAVADLTNRIEVVKQKVIDGKAAFDRIASTYVESSWDAIRGNGTESCNRINWSIKALTDATALASMDQQQWAQALNLVKQANGWLDEAESFMRSITALEENLAAAKVDAPREIELAKADIAKARAYLTANKTDVDAQLLQRIADDEQTLQQAVAELAKEKPDFLRVVKLGKAALSVADQVLAEGQKEHEAADRLRARVQSTQRDAKAAISRAKEYIEDHSADVKSSAKSSLIAAQNYLAEAAVAGALATQVSSLQKAEEAAEKAYSSAKSDVRDAEESRSRGNTTYIGWGVFAPSYHRSSGGGFGGGGSGGWGFGSGGGGSGGFGGFGGGGHGGFGGGGGGGGGHGGW